MITNNEITALNLSPTKKDFFQIWNELLEVAGKLSERWDPTSTNESDPGIVILKALTGIADRLNYNIDKRKVIFDKTGYNINSAIMINEETDESVKEEKNTGRRVTTEETKPVETEDKPVRRTYNVIPKK